MSIILKIAWRNIWRNPRRSWVLVVSIAVGVFGYLGTVSFSRGLLDQMIQSTINLQGGHIMIAAQYYHDNPQTRLFIDQPESVFRILAEQSGLKYAPIVSIQGMINSSETSSGVVITGVVPKLESDITIVPSSVVEGEFLSEEAATNQIVIGKRLADKLNVTLGEKVVLMTSDLDKNINSGAYRIVGLFATTSPDFDKAFVFLKQREAQQLVGYTDEISGIAIRLDESERFVEVQHEIATQLVGRGLEVKTWQDRNPLLSLALKFYDFAALITAVILFIAIAFSITNSFLMVIYERIREIGIMMANGVLPKKIRAMLYWEALLITVLGILLGLLATVAVVGYLGHYGLDMTAFAKGLGKFGVGSRIYPALTAKDVILGLIVIMGIVFLSVLYPSIKASRFEPVDAINFT